MNLWKRFVNWLFPPIVPVIIRRDGEVIRGDQEKPK